MATKIRLQRFGKKGKPFYHVVVADARSPRDGKFIERLGSYNPNTNPATIDIDFDVTLDWVNKGAQPTDTVRGILSYKGILYKKHLQGGVKKGALTEEQADVKFAEWLKGKEAKIEGKKEGLSSSKEEARKAALAAEAKKKEDRAAAIVVKNTPQEEITEEEAEETETVDAPETPAVEESEEAPAAEVAEEAPVAEATEEVVEEPAAEEAPVEETAPAEEATEAPAAEETTEEPAAAESTEDKPE